MPQPINRMVPDPHVYLDNSALSDKPEMAILVTQIFATWARIEQELSFLLVRVLGANSAPAIAMYSALPSQYAKTLHRTPRLKLPFPSQILRFFKPPSQLQTAFLLLAITWPIGVGGAATSGPTC